MRVLHCHQLVDHVSYLLVGTSPVSNRHLLLRHQCALTIRKVAAVMDRTRLGCSRTVVVLQYSCNKPHTV